ncbi:hypothetical protein STCU_00096 [Strigomonas culicis]|uniref:Paraflagellar rod component n=1 Tax=Strigomonas culicis TaxID=28005 RepID=S9WDJ7_9TRYP|nr:hypothetical protein STCU_00096 [Strigomonas culicis]|eukprot:EPY37201.1 hypothetical protein STCU_00096 [Strigomonas culicis]
MAEILVVNLSFNSPEVTIIGPIKESTIDTLNDILPFSTTSARGSNPDVPQFQRKNSPQHWHLKLDGQYCDAEGISKFIVILLDALEDEDDWKLLTAQSSNVRNNLPLQQNVLEHHKLIFSRK